MTSGQ